MLRLHIAEEDESAFNAIQCLDTIDSIIEVLFKQLKY